MDEKNIDDIIESFSAEANAEKELIAKIETEISGGKVPPKKDVDSLVEGINRLDSIYSYAYAFTKQNVLDSELPAYGSPIFALKKAIESSEMIALKKQVEAKKSIILQFINVRSDIEQYSTILAPYQDKAAQLLERINSSDVLTASKLLNDAALPELFIKAMRADTSAEQGIVTISLAGEKFGPIVLVGLSSKQYYISGEGSAAAKVAEPEMNPIMQAAYANPAAAIAEPSTPIAPVRTIESAEPVTPAKSAEPVKSAAAVAKAMNTARPADPITIIENAEKPVEPIATVRTTEEGASTDDSSVDVYKIASALLTNSFYSQTKYDEDISAFEEYSSGDNAITKYDSLKKLLSALLKFKKTANDGMEKYAVFKHKGDANLGKELNNCIFDAKDLYRDYVEANIHDQNERYVTTSDLILKKSVLSDCLEIVKDNNFGSLGFVETALHEYFIDRDQKIDYTNVSAASIDKIIDDAWQSSEDIVKGRKKSAKLPDALRNKLKEKIEQSLGVICEWVVLTNSDINADDAKMLSVFQNYRPEMLTYLRELSDKLSKDIDIANKDENPDKNAIGGMNALLNVVSDIYQKISG